MKRCSALMRGVGLGISRRWLVTVLLPIIVVVFPVGVDLVNGYLVMKGKQGFMSVGVLCRGMIMLVGIYCLLRLRDLTWRAFFSLWLFIFLFNNLLWSLFSDYYDILFEINHFFKIAFAWLMFAIFLFIDEQFGVDGKFVLKLVAIVGFLTALSLFLPFIFGLSFKSYGDYSYGIKGFFNAQNDTGLTLLISLSAAIAVFLDKPKFRYLFFILAIIVGSLMLGTRAGLLGPFIIFGSYGIAAIFNRKIVKPEGMSKLLTTVILTVMLLFLCGSVYYMVKNLEKIDYVLNRLEQLRDESPRSRMQAAACARVDSRSIFFDVFGESALQFRQHIGKLSGKGDKDADTRANGTPVEDDPYDIFGDYGMIFFGWLYLGIALLLFSSFYRTIVNFNRHNIALLIAMLIYLGHSSVAGHALVSPQVGNAMGPLLFLIWVSMRRGSIDGFRPVPNPDPAAASGRLHPRLET